MEQTELVVRLANAAENARDREEHDLAELLDEAADELTEALGMVDTLTTPEARRFMARHSSTLLTQQAIHDMEWQQQLTYLLAAAGFMQGKDRAPVADVLAALGLNNTQSAHAAADTAMRVGGYTRHGGEYARRHNVGAKLETTAPKQ